MSGETKDDIHGLAQRAFGPCWDELTRLPILKRLKLVGFLGVTAQVFGKEDSNRYDHSLAVADLAVWLAQRVNLSESERNALALYYLLHDVGHMPNSHVTEPLLRLLQKKLRFHESFGRAEVVADSRVREWCLDVLPNGGDTWLLVCRLLSRNLAEVSPSMRELLSTPIEIDRVEGICRTARVLELECPAATDIVGGIVARERLEFRESYMSAVRKFWSVDQTIYDHFVFGLPNQAAEATWKKAVQSALVDGTISQPEEFARYTDAEAREVLEDSHQARELILLLKRGMSLSPLWVAKADQLWRPQVAALSAAVHTSLETMLAFEQRLQEVFGAIGVHSSIVAPHFTRARRILSSPSVAQGALVDRPLSDLQHLLGVRKTSGLVPLSIFGMPPRPSAEIDTANIAWSCGRDEVDRCVWKAMSAEG
jgi:HD superfamily phosphohydrolase